MSFKVKDHYYKKAKEGNYLARSIFKLEEIDKKFKILKSHYQVIDCGYYPGSWTQFVSERLGEGGQVVGIDIQPVNEKLEPLENVSLFEKDIYDVTDLSELGVEKKFDLFLSDMAPKTTGVKSVDQLRSLNLVEMVFELLPTFLRKDGSLVVKVFDSNEAQVYLKNQKKRFNKFEYLKPKSTRSVSKEFFVIGKGFKA